jgi:hypothetical protein
MFTNYIDELLIRLQRLGAGCHIGQLFCGAFGYADDVILLAPTRQALKLMMNECLKFASEYDLLFNIEKSQYLIYDCNTNADNVYITFNNKMLHASKSEIHLGNLIGYKQTEDSVSRALSAFYRKFNVLYNRFNYASLQVKCALFKTHCLDMYCCQLWDLTSVHCTRFHIAWRKAVRRLLGISNRTHNRLIPLLCQDIPIEDQINVRFIKFFHAAINSDNVYVNMCAMLAQDGSKSNAACSLNHVSYVYKFSKYDFKCKMLNKMLQLVCGHCQPQDTDLFTAGAISDFLGMRDDICLNTSDYIAIQEIIDFLCKN